MKKLFALFLTFVLTAALFSGAVLYGRRGGNFAVCGVTPHHLLAKDVIRNFFRYASENANPDTVVILSPDHFHAGPLFGDKLITVKSDEFLGIKVDVKLRGELLRENPLALSDAPLIFDHGVRNLAPFVKKYFPHSKILPFLIPRVTDYAVMNKFVKSLDRFSTGRVFVIASVDFSHYLPKKVADFHDVKSMRVLMNFEKNDFSKIDVDCWQALYAVRYFAKLRKAEFPYAVAHKNANDYVKGKTLYSTTSYFSVVFRKGRPEELLKGTKTLTFTGDIMLGRYVGKLISENSPFYPFEKIEIALRGTDFTVGNLEGPIRKNPVKFPEGALKFCFGKNVAGSLAEAHFNILSLANNHTLDTGEEGLSETRRILEENGITPVGDPRSESPEYCVKKENIVFLAFNTINNFDYSEMLKTVKEVRKENPKKFLIVIIHWGIEYEGKSSPLQRHLAHEIIDSGADLIIGAHPHVVQEIEEYAPKNSKTGKLIFYSLGNFVFDQYFSKETQTALMVGLELSQKEAVFYLFPAKSELSQPELMNAEESAEFLKKLSEISDKKLAEEIKKGIIKIKLSP